MSNPDSIEVKIPVDCDERTLQHVERISLQLCGAVWGVGRKVKRQKTETTDQHHWPTWTHYQFTFTLQEDDSE